MSETARLATPLNLLTTNTCEWKGGPLPANTNKAFRELKSVLILEPAVHYPDTNLQYALITEASLANNQNPGRYSAILAKILILKCAIPQVASLFVTDSIPSDRIFGVFHLVDVHCYSKHCCDKCFFFLSSEGVNDFLLVSNASCFTVEFFPKFKIFVSEYLE